MLIQGSLKTPQLLNGGHPCGSPDVKPGNMYSPITQMGNEKDKYNISGEGETDQILNQRGRGHASNIRRDNDNVVSKHYN